MKERLIDVLPFKVEKSDLHESVRKNDGRLIVKNMIIQRANTPNKNRRIYSKNILERETSKLIKGAKSSGAPGIIGELDHPNESTVSLKNACIGILDYRWNGNDQLGDIEILPTPSGNILRNILEAGYVPGISSRGMGSVRNLHENDDPDLVEVEDDFEMVTWDAVSDPSTHNAYFKELKEGRQLAESFKRKHPYQKASTIMQDIICSLSGVCCLQNH